MLTNLLESCALAEAWNVLVFASVLATPPDVIGVSNVSDVFRGQVAARTVQHVPQLASVDEQCLA